MGCSPAAQQTKVPTEEPAPDCSSLDLTQKVGFSTSFIVDEIKYCYRITNEENSYSEVIFDCDDQGKPLEGHAVIIRNFTGPEKGYMQLLAVLKVSEEYIDYISFFREPSGGISTLPFAPVPDNLEELFSKGGRMLDQTKNVPQVCKELLEYKTQ